jgi:hypothetical protein
MIIRLVGIAALFAAGSSLPAATPALGTREVTPATMAPLAANPAPNTLMAACGRRCASRPTCGRRCATIPTCGRRCAYTPTCGRRCANVPRCGRRIG